MTELELFGERIRFLGALSDGSSLFELRPDTRGMVNDPVGHRRDPVSYRRYDRAGELVGTLATAAGTEAYLMNDGRSWADHNVVFGRYTVADLRGSSLALGTNDSISVRIIAEDGRERLRFDRPGAEHAVTEAMVEAVRTPQLLAADSLLQDLLEAAYMSETETRAVHQSLRGQIALIPHRATLPAFIGLQLDDSEEVWLRESGPESSAEVWVVRDRSGDVVGRVELHGGDSLIDIGSGRVLVERTDELDRVLLAVYDVVRGEAD